MWRRLPALDRALFAVVGLIALVTLVGLVALWPHGGLPRLSDEGGALPYVKATVRGASTVRCDDPEEGLPTRCRRYTIHVTSGSERGQSGSFLVSNIDFSVPSIARGDRVVLS
ncbi:MAG: hypothetical protein QOI61_2364, partial [Actinomycetota bacterium]